MPPFLLSPMLHCWEVDARASIMHEEMADENLKGSIHAQSSLMDPAHSAPVVELRFHALYKKLLLFIFPLVAAIANLIGSSSFVPY